MKTLNKIVTVFAKIGEIACWIGGAFMLACTAVIAMGKVSWLRFLGDFPLSGEVELDAFGMTLSASAYHAGAYILFFIAALLCAGLWAMIFRNIFLIFKTAAGETKFSKGSTPFQPDNIRMVREIGIFMIAVPVVQFAASIIGALFIDMDAAQIIVDAVAIFPGLVVLCLSQFFAYGTQLQEETDGLL